MNNIRRTILQGATAGVALGALGACATPGGGSRAPSKAQVVVIGGGYGGATAAKYIRMWSDYKISVVLVEPNADFVSCPISNLVIGGTREIADITTSYDALERAHGVRRVRDTVTRLDADARKVTLAGGDTITYDKLVVSPGIDFMYDSLPGLQSAAARETVLHAWKAGPQTVALRRQLEAMPDGGVYAMAIPMAPYRCPPGPYERACMVAAYFKREKPRSKVLLLDANDDVTSKGKLFKAAWAKYYQGIIEYRPKHTLLDVDVAGSRLLFEFNDPIKASVLNVVPPQRAGSIAVESGLATANGRWCEVNFIDFESKVAKDVHILGDAIQPAPTMPKSGHMANQQAKVCAAAIVAKLSGRPIDDSPLTMNTCYSFVNEREVVHVASVHAWNAEQQTYLPVQGSGGLSAAPSEAEGLAANAWARNIWADMLG
ncbi:MAG: NAD(P)/FAD-dependent oxidoreductase [Burkholderiaceae bacterium]